MTEKSVTKKDKPLTLGHGKRGAGTAADAVHKPTECGLETRTDTAGE